MSLLEIADQATLSWLPAQYFPRMATGGWVIKRREVRKPAKVSSRFLGALAHHWNTEASANDLRDVSELDALLCNSVIARACGALLEHQPEELSRIEAIHRRPQVASFAHERRQAALACNPDQQ